MRGAIHAVSARRIAGVGVGGLVVGLSLASCGARTGLEPDKDPQAFRDGGLLDASDADVLGAGGSCPISGINEENAASEEAGVACMAGEQLLLCDVASTGIHNFDNYCVTSSSSCSAVEDPSCEAQCNSGEFGLLCSDLTTPNVPGCRTIFPSPSTGPSGFAFCCPCID